MNGRSLNLPNVPYGPTDIEQTTEGVEVLNARVRRWIGYNQGFRNNNVLSEQELIDALESKQRQS